MFDDFKSSTSSHFDDVIQMRTSARCPSIIVTLTPIVKILRVVTHVLASKVSMVMDSCVMVG